MMPSVSLLSLHDALRFEDESSDSEEWLMPSPSTPSTKAVTAWSRVVRRMFFLIGLSVQRKVIGYWERAMFKADGRTAVGSAQPTTATTVRTAPAQPATATTVRTAPQPTTATTAHDCSSPAHDCDHRRTAQPQLRSPSGALLCFVGRPLPKSKTRRMFPMPPTHCHHMGLLIATGGRTSEGIPTYSWMCQGCGNRWERVSE